MVRNPFVARGLIKSDQSFWGRVAELQTLYSLLFDSAEEPQSVAIVGLRKIGKSSLLYSLTQRRNAPDMYVDQLDRTVWVMLSMQALSNATTDQFFTMILDELQNQTKTVNSVLPDTESRLSRSPSQALSHILRLMDREEYQLVLLLDEFECAATNPHFEIDFFNLLRSMAQQWRLAFVVASQIDLDQLWDKSLVSSPFSSPFFNFFQTLTLRGFRDGEDAEYLKAFSTRGGYPFGDAEIEIVKRSGGVHPFFINVAAYHVFQTVMIPDSDQLFSAHETVWAQVTQDPTIYGNLKYYWQNLSLSRQKILFEAAEKKLRAPFSPDAYVEIRWLDRMGLLEKRVGDDYVPFSKTFEEFILRQERAINKSETGASNNLENTLQDLISESESAVLEFKSSLRWDYHQGKINKDLELEVVITLAAFMNTDGGSLLIGVDDDGKVLGLEKDYHSFRKKNRDGFELYLTRIISDHLGKEFCHCVRPSFHSMVGDVCKVDVQVSPEPVYVGEQADFYVRTHNSTQKLNTREAISYIKRHWTSK